MACTDKGNVSVIDYNDESVKKFSIGQDLLCRFKRHAHQPHLFATGGDERDLHIWDINTLSEGPLVETWKAKNVFL